MFASATARNSLLRPPHYPCSDPRAPGRAGRGLPGRQRVARRSLFLFAELLLFPYSRPPLLALATSTVLFGSVLLLDSPVDNLLVKVGGLDSVEFGIGLVADHFVEQLEALALLSPCQYRRSARMRRCLVQLRYKKVQRDSLRLRPKLYKYAYKVEWKDT